MNEWPIGFSTGCFYRRSIFEVLGEIHASGFRQIEVCSFPKHLDYHNANDVRRAGDEMRRLGLRPFSFHAPLAPHIDITAPDDTAREGAVKELITACEAAAAMSVEHIVLHPGPEREGRPHHEEFVQRMHHASDSLNRVADRCGELGIHLLLENMLPHLLFGHISDMLYLLGEIRNCEVGTCLDTGHAFLAGEIGTVIQKLSGHLQLVHINDNRGDSDAHLPPGQGHIDWAAFISGLHRARFAGSLILEIGAGEHEPVGEVLTRAGHAREFLARLCSRQEQ
jgi:sugar phosphate isomerase/epimerase